MVNQIDSGIGRLARETFSPNRPTPDTGYEAHGIHEAVVVDDIDEQRLGRVYVYVPGISQYNPHIKYERTTSTRDPANEDGTPGAPKPDERIGFMRVTPLSSHFGSDRQREAPNQPDGRNPQQGQSNSYGLWSQHRNGDMVMVGFANGNPNKGYIIGSIPKPKENDMVPGHKPQQTDRSGDGTITNIGPSHQVSPDDKDVRASTVIFNNLTDAGLIQDPIRGLGSSSSTRETPSRVWGYKSPGDPDKLYMGHQIVMDDHPDTHLMRFRTSKGSQVLLSDTGDFIMLNTATGKVWFEIDDTGNVLVFAHSSISLHTEQDINLTADRDFNLHVGGNINWAVLGDTRIRMAGGANLTVGESGGDLDITTINNMHFKIQGEWRVGAKDKITIKTAKEFDLESTGNSDINIKSGQHINTQSKKKTNMRSDDVMEIQSKDAFSLKAKKTISVLSTDNNVQLESKNLLSLKSQSIKFDAPSITSTVAIPIGPGVGGLSIDDLKDLANWPDVNQADIPVQFSVNSPPTTSGPPATPGGLQLYAAPIVPQHHPWHVIRGDHPGHDAAIDPKTVQGIKST